MQTYSNTLYNIYIYINKRTLKSEPCVNVRVLNAAVCCLDSSGSCFHNELSTYCQDWSQGIKRESVNVKQVMTESDKRQKYPLSPSGVLFYTLTHFNLPFNTIPSRLNFDHCHFANLQDWKDWDKCIIHPTHQFGSSLLPVMHFSHLAFSLVFCSVCSVVGRHWSVGIWNGLQNIKGKCHKFTSENCE